MRRSGRRRPTEVATVPPASGGAGRRVSCASRGDDVPRGRASRPRRRRRRPRRPRQRRRRACRLPSRPTRTRRARRQVLGACSEKAPFTADRRCSSRPARPTLASSEERVLLRNVAYEQPPLPPPRARAHKHARARPASTRAHASALLPAHPSFVTPAIGNQLPGRLLKSPRERRNAHTHKCASSAVERGEKKHWLSLH